MKILIILISILLLGILYLYLIKNKINENFQYGDTYRQVVVTPQPQIYTDLILYTDNYNTVSKDIANNISNYYPIHKKVTIESDKILEQIEKNKDNIGLIQEGLIDKYVITNPETNIRYISNLAIEKFTFIVPQLMNIRSWKDMPKIKIGTITSSASYDILKTILSITNNNSDIIDCEFTVDTIVNKFKNKEIEAYFLVISHPNLVMTELLQKYPCYMFGTRGIEEQTLINVFPFYYKTILDVNEYSIKTPSTEYTLQCNLVLIAHKDLDALEMYILTRAIFHNMKYMIYNGNYYYKLQMNDFNPQYIYNNFPFLELHDGTRKFYRDIGILTDNPSPNCAYKIGIAKCNLKYINKYRNMI